MRSILAHIAWNVDTHTSDPAGPTRSITLDLISAAALLVKVTARIL
ncbi:MAG: hypothetical protein BWY85_01986 [Firmicutes bacterium ADurb.Bin506]|nr:MAG: hypothetical protein BWY85_01986 [Firmicutes bacterium ADurb.Bin506]